MLNKFFAKPIEMTIGEQSLKFSSLADFEFALSGRTCVPSKKITSMVKFSIDELKKEAKTIKEIEKKFVSILSKSIEDPESINRALREMDGQIFSQDNGWRTIISALHEGGDDLNEFRRVALVKYMQYLSSRQEIIKYLYSEKKKHSKSSGTSTEIAGEFKDTLMLENTVFEPLADGSINAQLEKMPKGENVTVKLKPDDEMIVLISKHPCKIICEDIDSCKFVDEAGRSYKLKIGKNVIGRDSKSDIMLDPSLRDVSRMHLVIELDKSNTLYMTDLSAHGTYILQKYLESHSFQF